MMISKQTKISIIIPIYNEGKRVVSTLKSVTTQDFSDFEIICVDDASTDETQQYLQKCACSDNRIKILRHEKRCGQSVARHTGLLSARGKYVLFVDSGDRILPHTLATLYSEATSSNSDVVIMGSYIEFGKLLPQKQFYHPNRIKCGKIIDGLTSLKMLASKNELTTSMWDKLYSRDVINRAGVKPVIGESNVGEDFYFNFKVLPFANKIATVNFSGYVWKYSGMGKKYYLDNWDKAIVPYQRLFSEDFSSLSTTGLSMQQFVILLHQSFMNDLQSAVVQRIIYRRNKTEIKTFTIDSLNYISSLIQHFQERQGGRLTGIKKHSANYIYSQAKSHLRRHRKFYIFTWLINRLRL